MSHLLRESEDYPKKAVLAQAKSRVFRSRAGQRFQAKVFNLANAGEPEVQWWTQRKAEWQELGAVAIFEKLTP
jgi:hypothetical protein